MKILMALALWGRKSKTLEERALHRDETVKVYTDHPLSLEGEG